MQHSERTVLHHEITNKFIANMGIYNLRGEKERHKVTRYQTIKEKEKMRDIRSLLILDWS